LETQNTNGLAIDIKKYLKAKRRIMEIQKKTFHHCEKYNLPKNLLIKETKILPRYYYNSDN
jgi:hypothetical protein